MLGNQPKMKADAKGPSNQLAFKFIGGSNINPAKDMHMHCGTLTILDDDHIEFNGECWADGKGRPVACRHHGAEIRKK